MRLTERQERRINLYLREVVAALGNLTPKTRDRVISSVKRRILGGLNALGRDVRDDDVEAILRQCGSPMSLAAQSQTTGEPAESSGFAGDAPIWLGVCRDIAEMLRVDVVMIRLVALLLGVTGPISLILYLLAYAGLHLYVEEDRPRIEPWKLAKLLIGTLAGTLTLYVGARLASALALNLYGGFMDKPDLTLGGWAWLDMRGFRMLFYALILLLPIAALSGLAVAGNWDRTGKKVIQAGLAVFALIMCLGIASTLVGIILDLVEELSTQGPTLP